MAYQGSELGPDINAKMKRTFRVTKPLQNDVLSLQV